MIVCQYQPTSETPAEYASDNPGCCAVCGVDFDLEEEGYWEFGGRLFCEEHVPTCSHCAAVPFGAVVNPSEWFGPFQTHHAQEPVEVAGKLYCQVCADDLAGSEVCV